MKGNRQEATVKAVELENAGSKSLPCHFTIYLAHARHCAELPCEGRNGAPSPVVSDQPFTMLSGNCGVARAPQKLTSLQSTAKASRTAVGVMAEETIPLHASS